jgi:hypothetical protein
MKNKYLSLAQNLQSILDTQTRTTLIIDTEWEVDRKLYDKEDLINASLIFLHILWNISTEYLIKEKWMSIEQAKIIAEELWKNFSQTVLLWTWINTKKLFNK